MLWWNLFSSFFNRWVFRSFWFGIPRPVFLQNQTGLALHHGITWADASDQVIVARSTPCLAPVACHPTPHRRPLAELLVASSVGRWPTCWNHQRVKGESKRVLLAHRSQAGSEAQKIGTSGVIEIAWNCMKLYCHSKPVMWGFRKVAMPQGLRSDSVTCFVMCFTPGCWPHHMEHIFAWRRYKLRAPGRGTQNPPKTSKNHWSHVQITSISQHYWWRETPSSAWNLAICCQASDQCHWLWWPRNQPERVLAEGTPNGYGKHRLFAPEAPGSAAAMTPSRIPGRSQVSAGSICMCPLFWAKSDVHQNSILLIIPQFSWSNWKFSKYQKGWDVTKNSGLIAVPQNMLQFGRCCHPPRCSKWSPSACSSDPATFGLLWKIDSLGWLMGKSTGNHGF